MMMMNVGAHQSWMMNDFPQPNVFPSGELMSYDEAEFFDFDEIFKNDIMIPNGQQHSIDDNGGVVLEGDLFNVDELFKDLEKNDDNDGGRPEETKKNVIIINIDDDDDAEDEMISTANNYIQEEEVGGVLLERDDFVDVDELFKDDCEKNGNDGGQQEMMKNVVIIDDDDVEDEMSNVDPCIIIDGGPQDEMMSTSNITNTNTINDQQEEGLLMIQLNNAGPLESSIIDNNNGDLYDDQTTTTNIILPMGYRFKPKDAELIYCLSMKVNNEPLPTDMIHDEVNLYELDAPNLMESFRDNGDGEWYFVTRLKMKNKGHTNRDRTTPNGCWKATSGDHDIKLHGGMKVGYRKTLVYYSGKRSKTDWIMHEYRLQDDDTVVICRVHNNGKREQNKSNKRARHF